MIFNLPEQTKIVEAISPATNAGALTGDYVKMNLAKRCFVVVHMTQGNAAQSAITIEQATAAGGTNHTAITNAVPIWSNLACATSDTLVRRTAAVSYTLDVGVAHKIVVFEIDPATLADGYNWINVIVGASNAANIASAMYIFTDLRYQQATPPAMIA